MRRLLILLAFAASAEGTTFCRTMVPDQNVFIALAGGRSGCSGSNAVRHGEEPISFYDVLFYRGESTECGLSYGRPCGLYEPILFIAQPVTVASRHRRRAAAASGIDGMRFLLL